MSAVSDIKNKTDEQLILLLKEGNEFAITELFNRYVHLVYGVCMKYLKNEEDSHDTSMEVFEKLSADLKKHEVTYFKSWLYSVAKNHCLMQLRRDKKIKNSHQPLEENDVEWKEDVHLNVVLQREGLLNQMEAAIRELNKEQQLCISLFYLEEKSYQEVMQQTGFTFKEVKSHIQNGKRNLRLKLEQEHERKD